MRECFSKTLLAGISFFALTQPVMAQNAVGSESAAAVSDIVVTGSRITRAGFEAPTPVTVISTDTLTQKAPSNIPDALNQLPMFAGAVSNASRNDSASNAVRTGNYLNLRDLGVQRVLVMLDGQRLPPTGNNGGTDANLIPQMLVERVDIVTAGTSAVYGSDAVSGVVNFVLNDHYKGFKGIAQRGISKYGDNGSYKLGIAGGVSLLDDRLHIVGSAERFYSDGIDSRAARKEVGKLYTSTGLGTAASPIRYLPNTRFSTTAFGGYISSGPLLGQQFLPNGQVGPFVAGPATGTAGLSTGGDGAFLDPGCCSLIPGLVTNQFFGRATFDLSDDLTVFVQATHNKATSSDTAENIVRFSSQTRIFAENAFLPDNVRTLLGATPSFTISRPFNEWGGAETTQRSTATIFMAGLDGKLFDGKLKWNLRYQNSESNFTSHDLTPNTQRYYAAVDAVRNAAGQIVCRITITNPGLQDGCVPLNPMGVGAASQAALDYVFTDSFWSAKNKLDSISGFISGDLFDFGAGPVTLVVGGEYRKQTLVQVSNSDPAVPVDFTGIRGVPASTLQFFRSNQGTARGSYNVKEIYGEIGVPLLKDVPMAHSLELNGAFRYTDYSTSGSVETYKIGATYEPVSDIRFRGTYSRDIRAPSLYELFAGSTALGITYSDALTGVFGSIQTRSGGNPNLTPEIGQTLSLGAVIKPRFLSGFNASIDYYNIKIKDAIASPFTGARVLDDCAASNYTASVCQFIIRPISATDRSAANFPTAVLLDLINVSSIRTSGIDFEVSYRHGIGSGMLLTRVVGTRLLHYKQQNSANDPVLEYAGSADLLNYKYNSALPKWRANLEVSYNNGPLTLAVQERYIGSLKRSNTLVFADNSMRSVIYTDLNASFDIKQGDNAKMQIFATVNNLFNVKAPLFTTSQTPGFTYPTIRETYDIVGRYFTVGAKISF